MANDKLAFALDYPGLAPAAPVLATIRDVVGWAKIGLELFTREGPAAVGAVRAMGFKVFLDLKLHDIPETVERAVAGACSLDARLLTIHAFGGPAMIERAVQCAARENPAMNIAVVTVLTSLDAHDLVTMGVGRSPGQQVVDLALMAWNAGARAFVCAPSEVSALRRRLGPDALVITPGIRPSGSHAQDQKRVASARAAITDGSDLLVVGRPIRNATAPRAAAQAIAREIDDACTLQGGAP